MDIPEKLQRKAGKNYKGWFCYTFGITPAFALKHRDTGDFTHEQMVVAHGEELSVCDRFLQGELASDKFPWITSKRTKVLPMTVSEVSFME